MKKVLGGIVIGLMVIKPIWASNAQKEKFYLKGALGGGGGKDVSLFMWTSTDEEVKVNVGKGINLEGRFGYKLNPKSAIEIGIAYQKSPALPKALNGKGYFKKIPLTLTYIYQPYFKSLYPFYLGGGGGLYLSSELYREMTGLIETTCNYDRPFGFHILGGIDYKLRSIPIFCEFKYVFVKYKFKEGEENGAKILPDDLGLFNEWKKIDGNQWIFNIGFIYSLNYKDKVIERPID